jgi:competence protein ComEA
VNKGTIVCGIAAALLGSGLLWAAGSREETGISGWQTLNVSMEQAIGISDPGRRENRAESAPANSGAEAGDTAGGNSGEYWTAATTG